MGCRVPKHRRHMAPFDRRGCCSHCDCSNCPCGQEKKEIRISGSDEAVTLIEASILDNVTRESVESTLVKNGNRLVRNFIDVSV